MTRTDGNNIKHVGVPRSFVLFNSIWVISNKIKPYHGRIIWTKNNWSLGKAKRERDYTKTQHTCLALEYLDNLELYYK